jgi:hypothetical protein
VAEKYVKEIVNQLIHEENEKRVAEENEHRKSSGQKEMDPQERLVFDLRTNSTELRKKYVKMVYKGVVEEYGKDVPLPEQQQKVRVATDADLLAEIDEAGPQASEPPKGSGKPPNPDDKKNYLKERAKDGSSN